MQTGHHVAITATFFVGDAQDVGAICILVIGALFAGYVFGRQPASIRPGMAISLVASIALLTTFFPSTDVFQRAVALLVGMGLIALEVWFISKDGKKRDEKIAEHDQHFLKIAQGLDNAVDHLEYLRRQPIVEAEVQHASKVQNTSELYRRLTQIAQDIADFAQERSALRPSTMAHGSLKQPVDFIASSVRWVTETTELFKGKLTPRLIRALHELEAFGISDPMARVMADGEISLNSMLTLAERVNELGKQLLDHLARNLPSEPT